MISPNPYRKFDVDPAVVAKAVFRYLVRNTSLPVYRSVPVTRELVLMIYGLSLAVTDFRRTQARNVHLENLRQLDLNHFLKYHNFERVDDIDVRDAIADLEGKYGSRPVRLDESIVRDILETLDDCENRGNVNYYV